MRHHARMGFDLRGRRALVTGASSGIGAEIARELAARGASLVLAARRRDAMEELGRSLGRSHSIDADIVEVDLATEALATPLIEAVDARHDRIDVVVNNAGFGIHGSGLDHDWEDELRMLRLNVLCVLQLTKHYARKMRTRGEGRILQVASNAAFQPCPFYAAYGATKALVLHHAEALAEELRGSGVGLTTVCPGSTNTEFFEVSGNERNRAQTSTSLEPDEVAKTAVDAMVRDKRSVVPGLANKVGASTIKLLPRRVQTALARKVLE